MGQKTSKEKSLNTAGLGSKEEMKNNE